MKTLIIIIFCSIALLASVYAQGATPDKQDSTLIEYDNIIHYCDSSATATINKMLQVPDEKQLKLLAQQARDWTIRRESFEEAKKIYQKKLTK
jgi:hypothetical protein